MPVLAPHIKRGLNRMFTYLICSLGFFFVAFGLLFALSMCRMAARGDAHLEIDTDYDGEWLGS